MPEVVNFPQDFQQITPTDAASRGYDLIAATETERKKIFVGALINESQAYAGSLFSGLVARVLELETTIANLPQAGAVSGLRGWDTVKCQYKNASTITLLAGGQYICEGVIHTIETDMDVSISENLTSDESGVMANAWYHVIAGDGIIQVARATWSSDVPGGACLRAGCSTDSAGGVRPFRDSGLWYQYLTPIQLWSGTMPTTNQTIELVAYVPSNVRRVELRSFSGYFTYATYTLLENSGVFVNDRIALSSTWFNGQNSYYPHQIPGVFSVSVGRSFALRGDIAYPKTKIWLQAWQ